MLTVRQLVESGAIDRGTFYNKNNSRIDFYDGPCSKVPEKFLDCKVVEIYSDETICVVFADN